MLPSKPQRMSYWLFTDSQAVHFYFTSCQLLLEIISEEDVPSYLSKPCFGIHLIPPLSRRWGPFLCIVLPLPLIFFHLSSGSLMRSLFQTALRKRAAMDNTVPGRFELFVMLLFQSSEKVFSTINITLPLGPINVLIIPEGTSRQN